MWDIIVEKKIVAAQEEGLFDGLRGRGKPIDWEKYGSDDLAMHLLQSNGFTLPWIEAGNELDRAVATARTQLTRMWQARRDKRLAMRDWLAARERFVQTAGELNRRIRTFNLTVPAEQFQRVPLDAEAEVRAVMEA